MKTRYAIALASLLVIPAVHAADSKTPPPAPEKKPAMMPTDGYGKGRDMMDCGMGKPGMMGDLNLSADQQKQIDAIHEETMKKHDALREETHQKVLKVLTPEQAKKFEAHRDQMMEHQSDRMEKRAGQMEKRADRMQKRADHMKDMKDMKDQMPQPATTPAK